MSLLASLAFALAAIAVVAALRLTVGRYRSAALANIAALRDCDVMRNFRVQAMTVVAQQGPGGEVRRIATRATAARWIRPVAGLRAAA